jgi:hypothetical protein
MIFFFASKSHASASASGSVCQRYESSEVSRTRNTAFFVLTLGQILLIFRGVRCREDRVCQVQHALLRHSGRDGRHRDSGTSFIGKPAEHRGFVNNYVVPGTFGWNKVLEGDLRVMN